MKKLLLVIFCLFSLSIFSQKLSISGNVQDTATNKPLVNAVVMIVKITDSTLISFLRTDEKGFFNFSELKIDTVQVIISYPGFGDQSFYVFAGPTNNVFDFGKIILPPKSQQLNEVVIYAYKDPVYYKGDTLIYTADSFKVRPNATVEDLLRRLPGIKVDSEGKITSQGKEVSQVLVDGDEFFGTDPTVATKNLTAQGVESVQVYEKKNEDAADGGDETIQVMNLKMKEDAKKGYFGKVSGASDFQKYYEGEVLANNFKGSQKVSLFGLGSNTPRSSFGWGDMYKYGLDNEMNRQETEDGETMWYSNRNQNDGIPQTVKTGFYYSDKITKKTKLNVNYTYNNNHLKAQSSTRSQYFLSDSSYVTENESSSTQTTQSHVVNMMLTQTIDSLTELEIRPKLQVNSNNTSSSSINLFKTADDTLSRINDIANKNKANGYDASIRARLTKRFKKKDRYLMLNYSYNTKNDESESFLFSANTFYSSIIPNDSIDQKRESESAKNSHYIRTVFVEPFSKKSKVELEYIFSHNLSAQNKNTFNNFNGEYAFLDSLFTNDFKNITVYNRIGLKYIFDTKKTRFAIGLRGQENKLTNNNLVADTIIKYNTSALLPYLNYNYRFSENSNYRFSYYATANQPTINQLQPVPDNTNPNSIITGNPNLKPSFENHFEMSYNLHKPVSGKYVWTNVNFNTINNAYGNSSIIDSIGRTISQTVNVNGNYNGGFYFGAGIPFFSKMLVWYPNINGNINKNTNFINQQKNVTETSGLTAGTDFTIQTDSIEFSIGGSYTWNKTSSSLNALSNKPYGEQEYYAALAWVLPMKFIFQSEVVYTINSQRTQGYNINFLIWDAKLSKAFLKNDNLILTLEANDILNQNINTQRNVFGNVITDSKTNIISRYFLLRLTYKFNSTKTKEEDNDW